MSTGALQSNRPYHVDVRAHVFEGDATHEIPRRHARGDRPFDLGGLVAILYVGAGQSGFGVRRDVGAQVPFKTILESSLSYVSFKRW